ncbi:MAG: hypothetical protein ABW061_01895, partial [Polyangiaceae bacterium]
MILGGCAAPGQTNRPPSSASKSSAAPEAHAEVPRTVVTPDSTTDIPELFKRATALGQAKQYQPSALLFERAFTLDPDGPLADKSLFESAEMYDLNVDHEAALSRYEQVARRF